MRSILALAACLLPMLVASAAPPKGSPAYDARVRSGRAPAYFDRANLGRDPVLSATAALLMDAGTGKVLWARNADARRFPASTTKILTGLLFAESSTPAEQVKCTNSRIANIGESTLNVKVGETFSADDLLKGLLLRSANDGAVVIAEHVSGSTAEFARRMNDRAQRIGAVHSHFTNPHGLHDPGHWTTARDLALIAREALRNPRFGAIVKHPVATIERSLSKDRRLVAKAKRLFYDKVPGADGVKTGYTRPAGHCFVGSATRDGRRLIAVVLGAKRSACSETIPLIEWGFRRFPAHRIAGQGDPVGSIAVDGGDRERVRVRLGASIAYSWDRFDAMPEAKPVLIPFKRSAPVRVGDVVGRYAVRIGAENTVEVPLIATDSVGVRQGAHRAAMLPAWMLGGGIGLGLLVRWRHGRRRRRGAFAQGSRSRGSRFAARRGSHDRRGTRRG